MPPSADRFLEAMQPGRCPFCFLGALYGSEYVRTLLDESVNDASARKALSASGGFCRSHAWRAVEGGHVMGLSILYQALLRDGREEILRQKPVRRRALCPACSYEREVEKSQAKQFQEWWRDYPAFRLAFRERGFLCLAHAGAVLGASWKREQRAEFVSVLAEGYRRLDDELTLYLERQRHERRHEALGAERDAYARAIRLVSGDRP